VVQGFGSVHGMEDLPQRWIVVGLRIISAVSMQRCVSTQGHSKPVHFDAPRSALPAVGVVN